MKTRNSLPAIFILFILISFKVKAHTDVYTVDTKLSQLEWFAEKLTGKHNGTIAISSGNINDSHGHYTGTVVVDMKTIKDKDLESAEYKAKLENHLKSPDFFDAEKYPTSTFVITSITPVAQAIQGGATHQVKGVLTIKDKSNEINFDATVQNESNKMTCIGSAVIDRSKFDVKYGSKTFFEDIGDKIIYDNFTLKFTIVAVK